MATALAQPALEDIVSSAAETTQSFLRLASPNQLYRMNEIGLIQPLLLHREEGHRVTQDEATDLLSLAKTRGLW